MSQATFDDDELFGEAVEETRADVESEVEAAREALPDAEDVWDTEGDNTLGVLNGLKSALTVDEAREHLRQAKKWFTLGERAGAFDDAADLEADIAETESLIETIVELDEDLTAVTSTVPQVRSTLQDIHTTPEAEDTSDSE